MPYNVISTKLCYYNLLFYKVPIVIDSLLFLSLRIGPVDAELKVRKPVVRKRVKPTESIQPEEVRWFQPLFHIS